MTSPRPSPAVVDLFSGAGGLSLGAARAGFRVAGAVELDDQAFATHSRNFPGTVHLQQDISTLSGTSLLEQIGLSAGQLDGIVGGPPCQGFSALGRGQVDDERNLLFGHFFRLVAEVKPKFFVAENVPNILHPKYRKMIQDSLDLVKDDYILLDPFAVKANEYGAPTTRTRIFFIGFRKDLNFCLTPRDFIPASKIKPINVREALAGLPEVIDPNWQKEEDGLRVISPVPGGDFGKHLSGDIPEGVGDLEVIRKCKEDNLTYGCLGTQHGPEQIKRFAAVECGKKDVVTRGIRLDLNGFCYTIRAGTGKDKGSGQAVRPIHPTQPRVITPREAARLQGFPDWFVFNETKWHSFRQIGNSVSPIVAKALLSVIHTELIR